MTLPENASRHGHRFAQHRPGFLAALEFIKGIRVVVGCYEGIIAFFTEDLQAANVYISLHVHALLEPSKLFKRIRNIAHRANKVML